MASIVAIALLLRLHWVEVVVSAMAVTALSHSAELICWTCQLSKRTMV